MTPRTFVAAATVGLTLLTACTDTAQLLEDSNADVAVTTDTRFLDTLEFDAAGAPNNYVVRSNSSAEFDARIDPELVIESYQINNATAWDGSPVDKDNDKIQAAFTAAITDSASPAEGTPCVSVAQNPAIVECAYDVDQVDPASMLVRRFTNDNLIMIVVGNQPHGLSYIGGEFTAMDPGTAADQFPRQ